MTTNESDCSVSEIDYTKHWNDAYAKNPTEKLGWYEEKSTKTLELIAKTNLSKNAKILTVGAGSSTLIDDLLEEGYSNLIVNDISEISQNHLINRLEQKANDVSFVVDDLVNSKKLCLLEGVDLWNDRAVVHFFLKKDEQEAYFDLLKKVVKPNGFVIIAVFELNGAEKCCGLPLQRYNVEMLQNSLGNEFVLQEDFNYTFINPYGGERSYVYSLFQRTN